MLGVQPADVSTRCSSHPRSKLALRMTRASSQNIGKLYTEHHSKLSTKNLRCFYTTTATESDVILLLKLLHYISVSESPHLNNRSFIIWYIVILCYLIVIFH